MDSDTNGSAANAAGPTHEQGVIAKFDSLITRSARRASFYVIGSPAMAEDLAQDVRCHLLRVLEANFTDEPALIRRFITNALRDRIRFERCRLRLGSQDACELDERSPQLIATDAAVRPEVLSVAKWKSSLPSRLRAVFELLYRSGYTQREASSVLGLSQPRITQLHQELLERGRLDLSALAV